MQRDTLQLEYPFCFKALIVSHTFAGEGTR